MRNQEQPRVFFVHLQKTAGSELIRLLINHFGERAVYPTRRSTVPTRSRWSARSTICKSGSPHGGTKSGSWPAISRSAPRRCWREITTLTMVREPVERTLSYLRHRAQSPRDRDKSLEEIYEDRRHFEGFIHNHMTKMLALSPDELTDGMLTPVTLTQAHLARAKQRLAAMDAVGHQESFRGFCAELTRRFRWRLGRPRVSNTTDPTEVTPDLRARIAEDNALDVALHQFARGTRV